MSSMADPVKQCADLSASSFSQLVRFAPLVQSESGDIDSVKLDVGQWGEGSSKKVIDHLILGKPLPPCQIPDKIKFCLEKSGIILREYQVQGLSWLQFLKNVRLNGALCDDMGLGKTLQALLGITIAHEQARSLEKNSKPKSLVVCPSSVTGQWINEVAKIGLGKGVITVFQYSGPMRKKFWKQSFMKSDIIITSYPILRSDICILEETCWTYCVLDEGHLLKNPNTKTAKAARRLHSHHRLILSGTPVQNKVHELWSVFDWLMPNYLGNNKEFRTKYAGTITRGNLPGASSKDIRDAMEKLKHLHQQVLPFILRREKEDVLEELPSKIITDIPCTMTALQRSAYSSYSKAKETQNALQLLERLTEENDEFKIADAQSNGSVLKSLLSLRLICTHPSLVLEDKSDSTASFATSGKLLALNDLLRRAQIFHDEVTAADNDDSILYIDTENAEGSEVTVGEDDTATDIFEEGNIGFTKHCHSKCLIFSQYTQSLDVIENLILKPLMASLRYVRLDGRTAPQDRNVIVDSFQSDDTIKCMLLTSKVGSLGLNLQAADTVIFLESDWNPFVDIQAMDRSHRIGQKQNVKVYRLITKDSIEEKIMALQKIKLMNANAIVNTDNSTLFSMGTDRLLDLFTTKDLE